MAKTITIAGCIIVAVLAAMLGIYCIATSRWAFAAANAVIVAANLGLVDMLRKTGERP